jgi:hypothetical protein
MVEISISGKKEIEKMDRRIKKDKIKKNPFFEVKS